MSATTAKDCIAAIRALGHVGYVTGTTLFGPAMLGLRATTTNHVVVSDLWVSPSARGQGLGQRLLDTCIEQADLHRVCLQVRPCAFDRTAGGMTTKALRAWYARNQFCTVDGSERMVRGPQQPLNGSLL